MADRAYSSGVTIRLGLVTMSGDLLTLTQPNSSKKDGSRMVCPQCRTARPVTQRYVCEHNDKHGPFRPDEVDRALTDPTSGELQKVDTLALDEAKKSVLPDKDIDIQVHRREDVTECTYPSGHAYLFRPNHADGMYSILLDYIPQHPELIFVAKTAIKRSDKFVQLDVGLNGHMLVRELIWPEDMKVFDAFRGTYKDKEMQLAENLIDESTDDFDPEEYRKDSRARIAELAEAPAPKAGKKKATKKDEDATVSTLEAALANVKKKKAS